MGACARRNHSLCSIRRHADADVSFFSSGEVRCLESVHAVISGEGAEHVRTLVDCADPHLFWSKITRNYILRKRIHGCGRCHLTHGLKRTADGPAYGAIQWARTENTYGRKKVVERVLRKAS